MSHLDYIDTREVPFNLQQNKIDFFCLYYCSIIL